jgi:UDP-N-acetylglucosamine 2-epimerase (non-hydrolysing)
VDNKDVLKEIVSGMIKSKMPIVLSLHPRTKKRLMQFDLYNQLHDAGNVQIIAPQGYLDFLVLMKNSRFILTDSGGIQEEATAPSLSKRVLVLRFSTERPEAIDAGFARLVQLKSSEIIGAISEAWNNPRLSSNGSPYGKGNSSKRIVEILRKWR